MTNAGIPTSRAVLVWSNPEIDETDRIRAYLDRFAPESGDGWFTRMAELNPRREAFVAAYADPGSPTFGNGAASVVAAGYSANDVTARSQASVLATNPNVQESIRAVLERAGVTPERLSRRMNAYFEDEDKRVRSSSVRAGEILMRAAGMLQPESVTNVDARSLILPSAGSASISQLEELLASLGRAEAESD